MQQMLVTNICYECLLFGDPLEDKIVRLDPLSLFPFSNKTSVSKLIPMSLFTDCL
jgi:hypothetical protein